MLEQFLEFENTNNLFSIKISNIYIWHLIRINIYNEINMHKKSYSKPHHNDYNEYGLKHILKKIKQFKYVFNKNPFLNIKSNDVLIFNHPRRVLNNNLYTCLYTSQLTKKLNDNYTMIENSYNLNHFAPIPENNVKYTDPIILKHNLLSHIKSFFRITNLSKIDKDLLKKTFIKINKEFEINLDIDKLINKVDKKISLYKINYNAYTKIIKKIKPKVIIEVVSYANNLYEINKIAKELQIPTIELQHGTMGKYHIAYNFYKKRSIETFPDYVFTFGDYWKENTRLPIEDDKIISVGWPYYEKKVNEETLTHSSRKTILFISQGTIGEKLSRFAYDLFEKINFEDYRIIYKLHPGEYDVWKEKYPWLLNTEIEVIDNNSHDMHYYFAQSNIQIGVNSTAIFEGLGYGLRTYIVDLYGYQYMEDLYKNDYVSLISSSEDILKDLKSNDDDLGSIDLEYFWKSNSMENMIKEINRIVDNSVNTE